MTFSGQPVDSGGLGLLPPYGQTAANTEYAYRIRDRICCMLQTFNGNNGPFPNGFARLQGQLPAERRRL